MKLCISKAKTCGIYVVGGTNFKSPRDATTLKKWKAGKGHVCKSNWEITINWYFEKDKTLYIEISKLHLGCYFIIENEKNYNLWS